LCLLFWSVTILWFEHAAFATGFAPELLITIGVMTVLDNVLASTISTGVYDRFGYHLTRLSHFTYFEPLPIIKYLRYDVPVLSPKVALSPTDCLQKISRVTAGTRPLMLTRDFNYVRNFVCKI